VNSRLIKGLLVAASSAWAADIVYKVTSDISFANREKCILFRALPPIGFTLFEYVFETLVVVFVGTFVAVWLRRRFSRFSRFYPRSPWAAFAYASAIPVCACAAIPLLESMKGKLKFTTTMSFVLAAPLLSPYIIILSFSVLGFTYGVLRILSSFALVMVTAFILGLVERRIAVVPRTFMGPGCTRHCPGASGDIYIETFTVFRSLLPYLLIAGGAGVVLEYLGPRAGLLAGRMGAGPGGIMTWVLVGVPLYFCNGAEVLFVRPLVVHGFPLGTGVAFSMTSTAICATSIAMLLKVIGRWLTTVMVGCVVAGSLALGLVLNLLF
jgi:uncharacterized membrane protein YraQ (UPF0718 family)